MLEILRPSRRVVRATERYRAALATRLPIPRRRVRARAVRRLRGLPRVRRVDAFLDRARRRRARGFTPARTAATAPEIAARRGDALRRIDRRAVMALALGAVAGAAVGASVMYYADPSEGRRRRALVRDRCAHAGHVIARWLPRRVERRGRMARGVARGVAHSVSELVRRDGDARLADDETLVARVRSEVLRGGHTHAGEIHVEAYEGRVTLRGQIAESAEIRRLIDATKHVRGVRGVRSYLHLPGELPPNKAQSYEHEDVPAHMRMV